MKTRPRLVLHVGLPKTATTTLQYWADTHRDVLWGKGVWYPRSTSKVPKHQTLITYLRGGDPDLLDAFFDHLPLTETVFISSEGLSGHLPEMEMMPDRLRLFRKRLACFDVTLVLMLRAQEAWLRSYHQQKVCNPRHKDPELLFATALSLDAFSRHPRISAMCDTASLLERMCTAYGVTKTQTLTLEAGWEDKLCHLFGVPDMVASLRQAPRRNEGLDVINTEFMRQANDTGRWKARGILLGVLKANRSIASLSKDDRMRVRRLVTLLKGWDAPSTQRLLELRDRMRRKHPAQ